ncbi:HLA class II histocompatibility antigen, DM alpha chain [Fukomys damarensis]|uniref:HLA class II histocompatibility antigen, DM alpha chain n=2 Tax=Fukomys damarensis TaxID=885580 RepID=A0A091CWQ1_FUKDA|nr:HLA class II histocompatibility antigen, DM alpha chain [Fukomys damarensis]
MTRGAGKALANQDRPKATYQLGEGVREPGLQGRQLPPAEWCEGMDREPGRGAAPLPLLRLLWLLPHSWAVLAAHTPVWRDDLQNHTFRHTVFCQEGTPSIGLSESYDEDQLFSFDFSKNTRVPRLPEFTDWAQDLSDASAIAFDKDFCSAMVQQLDPIFDGQIPVSRGFPIPEVFTLKPLEFGKPNTLVCLVSNLFPPMLTVSWQHNSEPVEGAGPTFVSAVDGLGFEAFSYLNFTPEYSDVFSCMATHEIDSYTAIAYWVPHNALPSDLLENVLCGVGFGLGVLGIIVGTFLIAYFRGPCSGD